MLLMQELSTTAAGKKTISDIHESSYENIIAEQRNSVKGKFSVAEETKTAWNTDKEQRDIDESLKVNPDWAQTLAEIREYADGKAAQHIHIKYDGIGFIPLNELMKKETARPTSRRP